MNFKDNRNKNLNIRISEARLKDIKNSAKKSNMSLADFVVMKCLNLPVEEKIITKERKKVLLKSE